MSRECAGVTAGGIELPLREMHCEKGRAGMKRDSLIYRNYVRILERELVCAMGCTEPIALAFCAAKARSVLGAVPDRIRIEASGNIIKNVRSVVVPCTDGRKGMAAAAAIGVLGGDENAGLQVLASVTPEARAALGEYLERTEFEIIPLESEYLLDMILTVFCGSSSAKVRIAGEHTNIVLIEKNGQVLFDKSLDRGAADTPGAETVKLRAYCRT